MLVFDLLPINLYSCGMLKTFVFFLFVFFFKHSSTLSLWFCPCHSFCAMCCRLQIENDKTFAEKKIPHYDYISIILINLNFKYVVHVVYLTEYKLKAICKSLYFIFIYILHNLPNLLELVFLTYTKLSSYNIS